MVDEPKSVRIAGYIRDAVIVLSIISFALAVMWMIPGTVAAERVVSTVPYLLFLVLGASASKSILTRVLRAMVQQTEALTKAPPGGSSAPPPPDVPTSPKTGFTDMPVPMENVSAPPPRPPVVRYGLPVGALLGGLVGVLCCQPRPPNARELAHGAEVHACVDAYDAAPENAEKYSACRNEVDRRYGVDAGPWR